MPLDLNDSLTTSDKVAKNRSRRRVVGAESGPNAESRRKIVRRLHVGGYFVSHPDDSLGGVNFELDPKGLIA